MEATYRFPGGRGIVRVLAGILALVVVTMVGWVWMARDFCHGAAESKRHLFWFVWLLVESSMVAAGARIALRLRDVVRLARHGVVLSDDLLCVGGTAVEWEDVACVEHPEGVSKLAFRVRTRDGKKLDVYSGLENTRQLEETVKDRLALEPEPGE